MKFKLINRIKLVFVGLGILLVLFVFILLFIQKEYTKDISLKQQATTYKNFNKNAINKIPTSKYLNNNNYHIFQTFNNCGPAALSMLLSYYGKSVSQETLGNEIRPYQNSSGDNDDKSVTLSELAEKAKDYNLLTYHRPMGSINSIKSLISNEIPVLTRTITKINEDIGHYRIIKGYDDINKTLLQDDSLQGANLEYSYEDFNILWEKFNYEYLILVPRDKKIIVEEILAENANIKTSWKNAVNYSINEIAKDNNNTFAIFNLSVAYYHLGDYSKSVKEFEKIENNISQRTLWYQIEPILSYFELKNYKKVFEITDKIINNQNRAFSELYFIRGNIYLDQKNINSARSEFQNAVIYNSNFLTKIPNI